MILTLTGTVTIGHSCRVSDDDDVPDGYIWIGDRDLLQEVDDATWSGPVTVAWADQRFTGDLVCDLGWGYSEYTPVDNDKLTVGGHNILDLLSDLEGQQVTVWVADEPVNVLDTEGADQ